MGKACRNIHTFYSGILVRELIIITIDVFNIEYINISLAAVFYDICKNTLGFSVIIL